MKNNTIFSKFSCWVSRKQQALTLPNSVWDHFISSLLVWECVPGWASWGVQWRGWGDEGWTLAFGDADQRQDAHRAIVSSALVFSPLHCRARAKAQINSIWAGRGAPRGCSSNRQRWSEHMIAHSGFFPHCKSHSVSVLWSYHFIEL